MEFLVWMVIYGIARTMKGGVENTSAILKGTEPPEITKFKSRRENGSIGASMAAALTRPRKARKDKPAKEPGPTRQVVRAWKSNTAAAAVEKMQHRHQRRLQWYREHGATIKDEKWHLRQQAKLRDRQKKLDELRVKKGLVDEQPQVVDGSTAEPQPQEKQEKPDLRPVPDIAEERAKRAEKAKTEATASRPTASRQSMDDVARKHPLYCAAAPHRRHVDSLEDPTICRWCHQRFRAVPLGGAQNNAQNNDKDDKTGNAQKGSGTQPETTESTDTNQAAENKKNNSEAGTTSGGTTVNGMYGPAAEELHRQAGNIDGYCADLTLFADHLTALGWGTEVAGPARDMSGNLDEAAGIMRDVAGQMRDQGDAVAGAYERAPFAPDKDVLVRA
jgi:hypothetical protein